MARNKLSDLNNHLFAQLERLGDEGTDSAEMKIEIQKAQAMSKLASQIINSSKLVLQAAKMVEDGKVNKNDVPDNLISPKSP